MLTFVISQWIKLEQCGETFVQGKAWELSQDRHTLLWTPSEQVSTSGHSSLGVEIWAFGMIFGCNVM